MKVRSGKLKASQADGPGGTIDRKRVEKIKKKNNLKKKRAILGILRKHHQRPITPKRIYTLGKRHASEYKTHKKYSNIQRSARVSQAGGPGGTIDSNTVEKKKNTQKKSKIKNYHPRCSEKIQSASYYPKRISSHGKRHANENKTHKKK